LTPKIGQLFVIVYADSKNKRKRLEEPKRKDDLLLKQMIRIDSLYCSAPHIECRSETTNNDKW